MKIKPVGFYVLVETQLVEEKTAGGILLTKDTAQKEQSVTEEGILRAVGPTAYSGWEGCKDESKPAHVQWGVNIGDKVEFRKFEGKKSVVKDYDNFRYIPDTHIIGVIDNG